MVNKEVLSMTEMWQPQKSKKYREDQIVEMLYELSGNKSAYTLNRDKLDIVHSFNESVKVEQSEIINLVIPEGTRNRLDVKVGDPNLRLCYGTTKCYRVRIVAMANKFPGFLSFSRFYPVSFLNPAAVISNE